LKYETSSLKFSLSNINMPHTHVKLSQTGFQGRPHDDYEHAKIQSLNHDKPPAGSDKSHYLLAAVGELSAGEPVPVHHHGPAVLYIIEGELHIRDKDKPDEVTKLIAGDVIHIDQGSHHIFSTPNKAKTFGASYGPSHVHPEDYVVKK